MMIPSRLDPRRQPEHAPDVLHPPHGRHGDRGGPSHAPVLARADPAPPVPRRDIADETLEDNELREPRTAEELYRVGVAAGLMQERTLLLEELRRSGVEVLDSRADQIAARAIERYPECRVG